MSFSRLLTSRRFLMALAVCLSLQCTIALAINYDFIHRSPLNYFTEKDLAIANEKALEVLESGTDGETYEWRNEATGSHGSYTLLETAERNGKRCRRVRVYDVGGPAEMTTSHTVCREADGDWKILR